MTGAQLDDAEDEETFVVKNVSSDDIITFMCDGVKIEGVVVISE